MTRYYCNSSLGSSFDTDSEYVPTPAGRNDGRMKRRRRARRGRRTVAASNEGEGSERKRTLRNEAESKRVSKINDEYDNIVRLLGGVVNGAKKSRMWERQAGEGKLTKVDILEATVNYVKRMNVELEEAMNKQVSVVEDGEVSSVELDSTPAPGLASDSLATPTTSGQPMVTTLSPSTLELGCDEDMLDDDDSICDEETQDVPSASNPSVKKPHPQSSQSQFQATPQPPQVDSLDNQQQQLELFPISPDDVCLQQTASLTLYNAALVTCSPGDGLIASTVAANTPEISPGFSHFILSCQDFTTGILYDTVCPLSPDGGLGEGVLPYLTDTHSSGASDMY